MRELLAPRSIALIGASADASRLTARPQRYLRRHGFGGALHLVHRRASEINGEATRPDIPEGVEFAYVLLGTDHVEAQVAEAARKGAKLCCILADGFAEAGPEGEERQRRVVEAAHTGGMRVLGPNSMGVVNLQDRIACTVNAALEAESLLPGRVALVSQSGSMMGAILSRGAARGLGFSHLIGTGNEADLSAGEIAGMLVDDPGVDAVMLFLEAIRAPEAFAEAAAKAHARGKPIIAFKLGRSEYGAELAASHTGALAGSDAAVDAFFRAHGILRATTLEGFLELPSLAIGQRAVVRPAAVSVLTTTGGGGAMAVDALGVAGVEARAPDAAASEALSAVGMRAGARLLDMTLAGTKPDRIRAAIEALDRDAETAVIVPVIGSSAQFRPADAVAGITAAEARKPVAAFLVPQADASLRLLAEAGIAGFRTPESLADALRAFLSWRAPHPVAAEVPALSLPAEPDEADAREALAALGLESDWARFETEPAAGLRYPVALKILSPDLAHKTEVGGVALGILDEAALRREMAAMRERVRVAAPDARLRGFLAQPMARPLAEAILGYRHSPEVGSIVMLGAGGILAELNRDVSLRLAPVDEETAHAMIAEVRALRVVQGFRNLPRGDTDALARAIVALSRLALVPEVAEAEVNPLMIHESGLTVADAWVIRR
ncbi:acetate--CoA ligase family protein [Sabulicella glaciei]|uniref:Acetate--CoA ligase family protein n=1 Tax=Sabulicella glaciei TaxID=2984948 RepID=A0ABT3NS20_9PROT|nr:acetate--CoA ligase family protein [Roseococcus sp. MDT2-1-1]MCW8084961.1 acetate--CoA ligase family protein [Roseococcus sp. MDT2-1-1]